MPPDVRPELEYKRKQWGGYCADTDPAQRLLPADHKAGTPWDYGTGLFSDSFKSETTLNYPVLFQSKYDSINVQY